MRKTAEARAAYMRDYRARQRGEDVPDPPDPLVASLRARIGELEDEVRHLKRELAARPSPSLPQHQFNSRPFRPVPKGSGRSR